MGFRGLGYNAQFIENMSWIARKIFSPNNFLITLTTQQDSICYKCPYNKNGVCDKSESLKDIVKNRDLRVLKKLKFIPNTKILTKELWQAVRENIRPNDIKVLCKGCEWLKFNYCIEGLRVLRKKGILPTQPWHLNKTK